MNKEQKIRNEEVGRSWKSESGSPKMAKAISSCPPFRAVREASSIAVGFSQRITDANSAGLQPHILKMWLKPVAENIEYRISNIKSGSFGNKVVPHFLFLISYFLFLPMRLKPVLLFSISYRQLKQTACPDFSGAIEKENFNSFLYIPHFLLPPSGGWGFGQFIRPTGN